MSSAIPTAAKPFFRTLTENGHDILELLDSDDEMEPAELSGIVEDEGMSSDTMVGDIDLDLDMDSEDGNLKTAFTQ